MSKLKFISNELNQKQQIMVSCALCTRCNATVRVSFSLTLWDWTYDHDCGCRHQLFWSIFLFCRTQKRAWRRRPKSWMKRKRPFLRILKTRRGRLPPAQVESYSPSLSWLGGFLYKDRRDRNINLFRTWEFPAGGGDNGCPENSKEVRKLPEGSSQIRISLGGGSKC